MTELDPRRAAIADAAVQVIAQEGLRELTHRAIDRRLGLPAGSTSYYARTRHALLELVVQRLASRTLADLESAGDPPSMSIDEIARRVAELIERISARSDDQRARFALAVDLHADPVLHPMITAESPIRATLRAASEGLLRSIGAADPASQSLGLLVLVDGLLFDRLAGSGVDSAHRADAELAVRAYLRGTVGAA